MAICFADVISMEVHFDACPSHFSQLFTIHACATGVLSDTYNGTFPLSF